MLNRIISLEVKPSYMLQLTYDDGEVIDADFRSVVNQGGIFSPLADPDFFSLAAIDAHGRAVAWPGELEFCADALRVGWEIRELYQSFPAPQRHGEDMIKNIIFVEDI